MIYITYVYIFPYPLPTQWTDCFSSIRFRHDICAWVFSLFSNFNIWSFFSSGQIFSHALSSLSHSILESIMGIFLQHGVCCDCHCKKKKMSECSLKLFYCAHYIKCLFLDNCFFEFVLLLLVLEIWYLSHAAWLVVNAEVKWSFYNLFFF